jgi:uncharacterized OB-fold protein
MSDDLALEPYYAPREQAFARRLLESGLVIPTCTACGETVFPVPPQCPACRADDWAYPPADGSGRVVGHTRIHRPSDDRFDPPITSALVALPEGPSVIGRVRGDPADLVVDDELRFAGASVVGGHLRLSFERTD